MKLLLRQGGLLAVDKPPGISVIPGRGEGQSVRELLGLELACKVWVVHRLDRDTSGLLMVAKDDAAQASLMAQLKARRVKKTYLALVRGSVSAAARPG